ncbi:MAG: ECF-type sigma factor, partial [Planctomycetota bacterium]|nr:ECF-type sigma factor [Planctomycetota bacterium]
LEVRAPGSSRVQQQGTAASDDQQERKQVRGGMDHEKGKGPTPEEEAILHDCYQHYLNVLPDNLRYIAERHLAGYSNLEISEELDCSKRTIERKMRIILNRWKEQAADSINVLAPS